MTDPEADPISPATHVINGHEVILATRPSMHDPVSNKIRGNWTPDSQVYLAIQLLREGDLFLDLGASVGTFCIPVSKLTGARCLAIEALPSNLPLLQYAVDHNALTESVSFVHAAIMDENGEVHISGVGSHGTVKPSGDVVPSYSLDSIMDAFNLADVRLLKMDIEGCEQRALIGAERFLSANTDCVYIFEANGAHGYANGYTPQDLLSVFAARGMEMYMLIGSRLIPRGPSDFQELGNVDYVASPFRLEGRVAGFSFDDLSEETRREYVIRTLVGMNPYYRAFMQAQLAQVAPRSLLASDDIQRALETSP